MTRLLLPLLPLLWLPWLGCSAVRHIPAPALEPSAEQLTLPQAQSHYLRGRLFLLSGDLKPARAAFSMARVFDPRSSSIPIALGEVALVERDLEAASVAWTEATRVDPSSAKAWLYRARIERLQGRPAEAAAHYRRARDLESSWQAFAGQIDALMLAKQRAEAQAVMAEWVALGELSAAELAERGQRRLRLGDSEGAAADLFRAVEVRPEDHGAVGRWVAAVLLLEERSGVVAQLKRLRELAPGATAPLWACAVIAHAEGDTPQVQSALRAWAAIAPQDAALDTLKRTLLAGQTP